MTYVNPSEQFAVRIPARGQSPSTAPFLNARRGVDLLGNILRSIGSFFVRAAENNSRMKQIEALEAKSDAELAALGIKRDQIVHHVFRDLYHI